MGWAENKIAGYQHGNRANWLERRMLEHANPVHFALALIAAVGFVYGLWGHDWSWIIAAVALSLLGHLYCWTWPGTGSVGGSGPTQEDRHPVNAPRAVRTDVGKLHWPQLP